MPLDNNQLDGSTDFAQFLEKFTEPELASLQVPAAEPVPAREPVTLDKSIQYERSFERLERKIQELEEKFDASELQNEFILSELSQTREAVERQKDRDVFVEHLSASIANLKASVEKLTRAQQNNSFAFREPDVRRSFDEVARPSRHTLINQYEPDNYRQRRRQEQEEKERIIASLHKKASQLKAVSSALDREIKKVQQEKMEALKKSAEHAKEILSLRNQLTAAEERFKSFNFEGRIISIRQEYQQRVSHLETQLKEISDTCVKQVEEIESLRAENLKLQQAASEKEQALARLEEKERELQTLRQEMTALQTTNSKQAQFQEGRFREMIQTLETQRDELTARFQAAQTELEEVRREKDRLEKNFKVLVEKINHNDIVIEQLKEKIGILGRQNQELSLRNKQLAEGKHPLSGPSSALPTRKEEPLAPRNTGNKPSGPFKPQAPRTEPAAPLTNTVRKVAPAQPRQMQPTTSSATSPAAPVSASGPVVRSKRESLSENPVEIAHQAKAKVQTEEDLPEIKVAAPTEPSAPVIAPCIR